MTSLRLLPVLLLVLLGIWHSVQGAVMSIDYGTEWFKVGLIKPGIPLDIALNKDSKRKTQAVVNIRGEERIYGSDAVNMVRTLLLSQSIVQTVLVLLFFQRTNYQLPIFE